jgi:hypothetical protein
MDARIGPTPLGMLLHKDIYDRMVRFASEYTPEFPAEPVVTQWLQRAYAGDESMHILVTLNEGVKITGHIVVEIQSVYGYKAVWCHQAYGDKNNTSTVDAGVEYIEKLCAQSRAVCSLFTVVKYNKALEKKYGYRTIRTVMIKPCVEASNE